MGGTKKKSLSASSKAQETSSPQIQTEKKEEKKVKGGPKQQRAKISVIIDEKEGLKALSGLKAITPHALARNLGVKISIANAFIRSLESEGSVRCVGGYSGHKVYELLQQPQQEPQK
ncbi:MAG: MarR family transcriptional regulator [Nitrososphaerales archaeon]